MATRVARGSAAWSRAPNSGGWCAGRPRRRRGSSRRCTGLGVPGDAAARLHALADDLDDLIHGS